MRAIHRRYLPFAVLASAAVAAFVVVGGSGAGATPGNGNGNGKAQGVSTHRAPASGSVGGGRSSGDTTSPQPPSNGDFSGHGANVHGPYDSTRDGSPSGNGNGNGKAVGKPCAGCVGKADNKNPPGQMPNGSDRNAGYECDRNHGVGKTNPAHTGCTGTTTPPSDTPPSDTPPSDTPPSDTPPSDTPPSDTPPSGSSSSIPAAPIAAPPQSPAAGPRAKAAPANDTPGTSGLANTAAINAGLFTGIAGGMVVLGIAALFLSGRLTRLTRRRAE